MAWAASTNPSLSRYSSYSKSHIQFLFTALPCVIRFHQNGTLPICWCVFQKLWQRDMDKQEGMFSQGHTGRFLQCKGLTGPIGCGKTEKLRQTGEMWIWVLNVKCLLFRPFPADTWAQLESGAEAFCCHIWPRSCQPQPLTLTSTTLLFSRVDEGGASTGPGWVSSTVFWIFMQTITFLTDGFSFHPQRHFFWVWVARDLLVSVGKACRSPPALEILPGLHPRLYLLRQSLYAPAVTLAGLGRATAIFGVFKFTSAFSIIFAP